MDKENLFKFCFGCVSSEIGEKVIMTPFLPVKYFREYLEASRTFNGRLYSGFTTKNGVTVVRCGIGDRLMGDAVLLIGYAGARQVVFTGTCAGLEDCEVGDFVVADSAFNGEGFSKYYDPGFSLANEMATGEVIEADAAYSGALFDFLQEHLYAGRGLHRGAIFTMGSLVAEHERNLAGIEAGGFFGIDMELSAVYRGAAAAGVSAVGFLMVSDRPLVKGLGENLTGPEQEALDDGMSELVRLSVEFTNI